MANAQLTCAHDVVCEGACGVVHCVRCGLELGRPATANVKAWRAA